jgi:hypothetical protein
VLFTYAVLDVNTKQLISKNNLLLNDTTAPGDMQACRHANGRDWWIIKPGIYEDQYQVGLLDPTGFHFQPLIIDGVIHRGQFETFSYFSHDGLKYIHFTGKRYKFVHEYDFDRCTGQLSNLRVHNLSENLPWGYGTQCTLSPNGSKIYFSRGNNPPLEPGTFQYDFESSSFIKITEFGGAPMLAPNGKTILIGSIIFGNNTYQNTISEIENPNGLGTDCNIILHKYTTVSTPKFVMPSNFANFRLGPIDGSSCDTLGINNPTVIKKVEVFGANVFPNPFTNEFTIQLKSPPSTALQLQVFDGIGRLVHQNSIVNKTTTINTQELAQTTGLFYITLTDVNGKVVFGKKMLRMNN